MVIMGIKKMLLSGKKTHNNCSKSTSSFLSAIPTDSFQYTAPACPLLF